MSRQFNAFVGVLTLDILLKIDGGASTDKACCEQRLGIVYSSSRKRDVRVRSLREGLTCRRGELAVT